MKKVSYVLIFVSLILIVLGYSISVVKGYRMDVETTKAYASLIKNSYNSYYHSLEEISSEIKDTTILDVKYYSQISNNYKKSVEELNTIEDHIKSMQITSEMLNDKCASRNYNDYEIDDKCASIKYNYESVINAFVSIVGRYNERIDEYNEWNQNKDDLNRFEATYYKDYVDLNEDGEYSGKL